jgi:succinate-semialdehyde dehydrogenase / glutarate-semialdehyde dehydrogenase
MALESVNPATGERLRSFQALSSAEVEAKLALAADAGRSYPLLPLPERGAAMHRLADLLESEADRLARTITEEVGKPITAARQEVLKCASVCRYYAKEAENILRPQEIETEHTQSHVRYDPLGVVLAIMPWNFPFWQVFRFLAPALMAGNVGLLKHADTVPQCALLIEELTLRAGFSRGVFQALLIEVEQVGAVLADNRVAAVTLTGSEHAGRAVAEQAGRVLKKCVLELGGSDPFIVLPSADMDAAAATAVKARCINSGQSCIAAKRFLVHEAVYEPFQRAFVQGMAAMRVGDPARLETEIGPLANARQTESLLAQIEAAQAAGGRVLTGGGCFSMGEGYTANFVQPTVIADVPRGAPVVQEETFGPLALLFRISSVEDAVALANDTPFGLAASVWTNDLQEQQAFLHGLQCGSVFFNAMVASDPRLPFGGVKHSGYGRELAAEGMREFLNVKTVVVARPESE